MAAGPSRSWTLLRIEPGFACLGLVAIADKFVPVVLLRIFSEHSSSKGRDYADFWVAAALGDTASTVRICSQWGIADQDAAELFASLTQFRRVRLGAQRLDAMASLFGSRGNKKADVMPHAPKKLTAKAMAEAQQKLKARAKKVLGDTAAFPRELGAQLVQLGLVLLLSVCLGMSHHSIRQQAKHQMSDAITQNNKVEGVGWRLVLAASSFLTTGSLIASQVIVRWAQPEHDPLR